jgi:M6 family metalloprotease-like protein
MKAAKNLLAGMLLSLLICLPTPAIAAYLSDVPTQVMQPDGTSVLCYASGDEHFNYLHDETGALIIQNPDTGFYTYAKNENGRPTPSEQVVGQKTSQAGLYRSVTFPSRMTAAAVDLQENEDLLHEMEGENSQSAYCAGQAPERVTNLVIYIRFSDEAEFVSGSTNAPIAEANSLYNTPTTLDFGEIYQGDNSVSTYMRQVSQGEFDVDTTFLSASSDRMASYQDIYPRAYYQPYSSSNPVGYKESERQNREMELLERAVSAVSDRVPDDMCLDYDGDGKIDNLTFFISGTAGAWNGLLWPHSWQLQKNKMMIGGKQAYRYNLDVSDEYYAGKGVLSHELMHTIGFPDLYRYSSVGTPVGKWDLMGATEYMDPQFLGAYLKYRYAGWGNVENINKDGTYTLQPVSDPDAPVQGYLIPTGKVNEYFAVEYRKQGERDNMLEDNPPTNGLIVSRVNLFAETGNQTATAMAGNDEVYILRPGDTYVNAGNGDVDWAALGDITGRASLGSAKLSAGFSNTLCLNDGTNSGIMISGVQEADSGVTFQVTFPDVETPTAQRNGTHNVASSDWMITERGYYTFYGTTTEHRIIVKEGVTDAHIIFANVTMDTSASAHIAPVVVEDGAKVSIDCMLSSKCTLKGGAYKPAIEVPAGASVTLSGEGSFDLTGGDGAAAVGGSYFMPGGNITIDNTTMAAHGGNELKVMTGSKLVIQEEPAPAIGGGTKGKSGDITIKNSKVQADSDGAYTISTHNADGTHQNGAGGNISIEQSTVSTNGAIKAGDTLSCTKSDLNIDGTATCDSMVDAISQITLSGSNVQIQTGDYAAAVGSSSGPNVSIAGGTLCARGYRGILAEEVNIDSTAEVSIQTQEKEAIIFAGEGEGSIGVPDGSVQAAYVLEISYQTPFHTQETIGICNDSGYAQHLQMKEGTGALLMTVPSIGEYQIWNTDGERKKGLFVEKRGLTRYKDIALELSPLEITYHDMADGQLNISAPGVYEITGTSETDGIVIADRVGEVTLRLSDVQIDRQDAPAIEAGKENVIEIASLAKTENQVVGGVKVPAIRCQGTLTIRGTGTLGIAGRGAPGISASSLKIDQNACVTVAGSGDAVTDDDGIIEGAETGMMPPLFYGTLREALSEDTDVIVFHGETSGISWLPEGTDSVLHSMHGEDTCQMIQAGGQTTEKFVCSAQINRFSDIAFTSQNMAQETVDISQGDYTVSKSGTYTIRGTTAEHTVTVEPGISVNLILDNVQMNLKDTLQDAVLVKDGSLVTMTLPDGKKNIIYQAYDASGYGAVAVSPSARLCITGGGALCVSGGREAPIIGGGSYKEGGTIVLESGTIEAKTQGTEPIIGGNHTSVAIEGGTIYNQGITSGGIGGANGAIKISGGTIALAGVKGMPAIGGVGAKIKISGGFISLGMQEDTTGIGGDNSDVTIKGGMMDIQSEGAIAQGIGGANARMNLDDGDITITAMRESPKGGILGGDNVTGRFGEKIKILAYVKNADTPFFLGTAENMLEHSGGEKLQFFEGILRNPFGSTTTVTLENGSGDRLVFPMKAMYKKFVAKLPEAGMYTLTCDPGRDAGQFMVESGRMNSYSQIAFNRVAGLCFEDEALIYNGQPQSIFVQNAPEGAEITYTGNEQTMPGQYEVSARIVYPGCDYTLTATMTIQKAPLTVIGVTAKDKEVYDGSCTAMGEVITEGQAPEDNPEVTAQFVFEDANVGRNKKVTATRFVLESQYADRYELTAPASMDTTAHILKPAVPEVIYGPESNLCQPEGEIQPVRVQTKPEGLAYRVTYDGTEFLPKYAGSYDVCITIAEQNYAGVFHATLQIGNGNDVSSAALTITQPGAYLVQGSTDENQITIADGVKDVQLVLGGVQMNMAEDSKEAIVIGKDSDVALVLPEGTDNMLSVTGDSPAITAYGKVSLFGSGSLHVYGGDERAGIDARGGFAVGANVENVMVYSSRSSRAIEAEAIETVSQDACYPAEIRWEKPVEKEIVVSLVAGTQKKALYLKPGCESVGLLLEKWNVLEIQNEQGRVIARLEPDGTEFPCFTGVPYEAEPAELFFDISDGDVTISYDGTYTIYGRSWGNQVTVSDGVKATIILSGVHMAGAHHDALIQVGNSCDIAIKIEGENTLENQCGAIHAKETSSLSFSGSGMLSAVSMYGDIMKAGAVYLNGGSYSFNTNEGDAICADKITAQDVRLSIKVAGESAYGLYANNTTLFGGEIEAEIREKACGIGGETGSGLQIGRDANLLMKLTGHAQAISDDVAIIQREDRVSLLEGRFSEPIERDTIYLVDHMGYEEEIVFAESYDGFLASLPQGGSYEILRSDGMTGGTVQVEENKVTVVSDIVFSSKDPNQDVGGDSTPPPTEDPSPPPTEDPSPPPTEDPSPPPTEDPSPPPTEDPSPPPTEDPSPPPTEDPSPPPTEDPSPPPTEDPSPPPTEDPSPPPAEEPIEIGLEQSGEIGKMIVRAVFGETAEVDGKTIIFAVYGEDGMLEGLRLIHGSEAKTYEEVFDCTKTTHRVAIFVWEDRENIQPSLPMETEVIPQEMRGFSERQADTKKAPYQVE